MFGSARQAAAQEGAYLLDSGDVIRMRVSEWPGLDGDVTVSVEGTLALPAIGDQRARGQRLQDLAKQIADRLRERAKLGEPPVVALSVVRYRPYFIMGDVDRAGEYEYQPGLTVLKAISRAGGFHRAGATAARDSIVASSELRAQVLRAYRAHIRLARIEAELAESETLVIPEALARLNDPEIKLIARQEQSILKANLGIVRQQIQSAEDLSKISDEEIKSLEAQIAADDSQLKAVQKEADRIREMESRGLTNASRVLDIEQTIARVIGERQSYRTAAIRAKLDRDRAIARLGEQKTERVQRLRLEQQQQIADLNDAIIQQNRSQDLVSEAADLGQEQQESAGKITSARRKYFIVRKAGDKSQEMEVDVFADVLPGDVVRTERLVPRLGVSAVEGLASLKGEPVSQ